jgi:hypothetical protein
MSPRTLERRRWIGDGPQFLKIGGRVIYRIEALPQILKERLINAFGGVEMVA